MKSKVIVKIVFSESSKSILFCKEGTTYDEKWEGCRIGKNCNSVLLWLCHSAMFQTGHALHIWMEFSSSELKQDIQRFQRGGVIPRYGWGCPSIISRWISLWLHQVEQKGGVLQYICISCEQSVLQVNLWYDFLEPRNQEVHNVMTQVSSFSRAESRYHVMSHLGSPQPRPWVSGGGWEEQPWQYGFPKVR